MDSLLKLEEGIVLYDALLKEKVLVVAPVMFIIADNPMASELCNHQGSTARRYCRMCLVQNKAHSLKYKILVVLIGGQGGQSKSYWEAENQRTFSAAEKRNWQADYYQRKEGNLD